MNITAFVGSPAAIAAAVTFAALCGLGTGAYVRDGIAGWSGATLAFSIVSGVLAFMAFVHTSRAVYARWLKVAEGLNKAVVSVLFGIFYLAIVPVFALLIRPFDVLRLRQHRGATSYWIQKKNARCDLASLQRLG